MCTRLNTEKRVVGRIGDLETQIAAFVNDYNHRRYHESIDNLTPADVYFGRGPTILAERVRIKRQTIANRCSTGCRPPDFTISMSQRPPLFYSARCLKNPDDGQQLDRFSSPSSLAAAAILAIGPAMSVADLLGEVILGITTPITTMLATAVQGRFRPDLPLLFGHK